MEDNETINMITQYQHSLDPSLSLSKNPTEGVPTSNLKNLSKHEQRWVELFNTITKENNMTSNNNNLSMDTLLDVLIALFEDLSLLEGNSFSRSNDNNAQQFLKQYQSVVNKVRSLRVNKYDFQVLKKLAKGHFGMVSVVRNKLDNRIYAMKTLNKLYILRCKELSFFMEERDVLSLSKFSEWIPKLYATFQDSENLYLVMEYAGGGDLFNLLDRNYPPIIKEDEARFYLAEIVLALNDLHKLGYVHRDLKPQNILIDNSGHIKLADFGSCIKLNSNGLVTSNIPVGTSDYISPEVLRAQEGNTSYGVECDWWSVGILLYELLQGDPPFSSENLMETHSQIMNHKNHLVFHGIYPISEEAKDLILKLICDKEIRLGKNGFEEIKLHPFFNGIDWDKIHTITPPFIPTLLTPDDTSNFSGYEGEEDHHEIKISNIKNNSKEFLGNHLPFIGFTYQMKSFSNDQLLLVKEKEKKEKKENNDNQKKDYKLIETQTDLINDNENNEYYELKLKELENKNEILTNELQNQSKLNQAFNQQINNIREQLMISEEEKNEISQFNDELEILNQNLSNQNQKLNEDNLNNLNEIKKLKKAINDLNLIHQNMKEHVTNLAQSNELNDNNLIIMKEKCHSLQYENQSLKIQLENLELKNTQQINYDEFQKIQIELNEQKNENIKLLKELEITKETNTFLMDEIKELNNKLSLNTNNGNTPTLIESTNNNNESIKVAIDNKLFQDIISNLELETKNHQLLTSIYDDLKEQKGLQPTLNQVKESRDEAIQRADQMLILNEKQANLIKTLMEKITYLEGCLPNLTMIDSNEDSLLLRNNNNNEIKLANYISENQSLREQLRFKDQKLQEIVTKLVLSETNKPSFWSKSKEKNKEKQKILIHTIESLEHRLKLLERENAQLRFINQLNQQDNNNSLSNLDLTKDFDNSTLTLKPNNNNNNREEIKLITSNETGRFTHLTIEDKKGIQFRKDPSIGIERNHHLGTLSLSTNVLSERSLSSKFGISHIK